MKKLYILLIIFPLLALAKPSDKEIYTLYRNSILDESMRIHVASFDAKDGKSSHAYNMSNCMIAQDLFQNQHEVKTKYWCERGKYK